MNFSFNNHEECLIDLSNSYQAPDEARSQTDQASRPNNYLSSASPESLPKVPLVEINNSSYVRESASGQTPRHRHPHHYRHSSEHTSPSHSIRSHGVKVKNQCQSSDNSDTHYIAQNHSPRDSEENFTVNHNDENNNGIIGSYLTAYHDDPTDTRPNLYHPDSSHYNHHSNHHETYQRRSSFSADSNSYLSRIGTSVNKAANKLETTIPASIKNTRFNRFFSKAQPHQSLNSRGPLSLKHDDYSEADSLATNTEAEHCNRHERYVDDDEFGEIIQFKSVSPEPRSQGVTKEWSNGSGNRNFDSLASRKLEKDKVNLLADSD
ncbi:hypothetical protein NADFUDRAFT_43336 [Nadsonia fulvescens var. elongata DSM 6958]|uniref:Pal1-domain-containing protein n=1 Tax=Nadsonia fulvescens var. elongata DSM 6958 TaxID=857566 RepID=A0A1E3PHB1_9ASCO|nr:hypothetical protein NADFUDRAFT_43336 [Nadsonia fulvescens var. elongata DSM 6958]